jgi:hypothetical protein
LARHRWLTPIILATQEAEIGGLQFEALPQQIVQETYLKKNPSQKRAGGVGPEFKPQYHKKKKIRFVYLAEESSKQSIEGVAWFLLSTYIKIQEERY